MRSRGYLQDGKCSVCIRHAAKSEADNLDRNPRKGPSPFISHHPRDFARCSRT